MTLVKENKFVTEVKRVLTRAPASGDPPAGGPSTPRCLETLARMPAVRCARTALVFLVQAASWHFLRGSGAWQGGTSSHKGWRTAGLGAVPTGRELPARDSSVAPGCRP